MGRYYQSDTYYVRYRIENGDIYEAYSQSPMIGTKTLLDNKLQIKYKDDSGNDQIIIFNFIDDKMYIYNKSVYKKENFSTQTDFKSIGKPIANLIQYSGNYYTSSYSGSSGGEIKYYHLLIGNDGQVYIENME